MNDDPDFDIKGPDIEWVSYGANLGAPLGLMLMCAVVLFVVVILL